MKSKVAGESFSRTLFSASDSVICIINVYSFQPIGVHDDILNI